MTGSKDREEQNEFIKEIRKFDVNNKLIVVAEGCQNQGVQSGAEALEYLNSGANACSIYSKLFTDGPLCLKEMEIQLEKSK